MATAQQRGAESEKEEGKKPKSDDSANVGFGKGKKKQDIWDKYMGKWVRITHIGRNGSYCGCIESVDRESGYVFLNPHQNGDYDDRGVFIQRIYSTLDDEILSIPIHPLPIIGPASQKGTENGCMANNRKEEAEYELNLLEKKLTKEKSEKPGEEKGSD